MSNEREVVITEQGRHFCCKKRVSWSAVLAGALVGIGISFLLNLFCVAIGLSVFKTSPDGATTLAIGGFIALLISIFIAMFVAGMTAGHLGRSYHYKRKSGILYGFLTWTVALIITAFAAAHTSQYVAAYTDYIYHNPTVVTVVNNDTSPAVSATSDTTPAQVTVNAQKAANDVGYLAFVVFVLFFVGAFASCLGGHCGNCCCKKDESCCDVKKVGSV